MKPVPRARAKPSPCNLRVTADDEWAIARKLVRLSESDRWLRAGVSDFDRAVAAQHEAALLERVAEGLAREAALQRALDDVLADLPVVRESARRDARHALRAEVAVAAAMGVACAATWYGLMWAMGLTR